MKSPKLLSLCTITAVLALTCHAQNPPGKTGGTTQPPAQKAKPFSSTEAHALLGIADNLQFQMNMSQRIQSRFRETDKELAALGARLHKEASELWTPMVELASAHGVEGKKIPMSISKLDQASVNKLNVIRDDDKWKVAYFDLFAKETRKNARSAETAAKTVNDPDLKAWIQKVAGVLQPQAELIETTWKDLKSPKKKEK